MLKVILKKKYLFDLWCLRDILDLDLRGFAGLRDLDL